MFQTKFWCLLSSALLMQFIVLSQEKIPVKFGKVAIADFEVNSNLIDSATNAIVIADYGVSEYFANTFELSFELKFTHKRRIKILTKNGFDAASVLIPLYTGKTGKPEEINALKATTYNLENGKVVETRVEKNTIFSEKYNKNWTHTKFTFPALQEGSIIEYSYEIKSEYIFNLQPWEFQGKYPTIWSQYQTRVPDFFKFVIISQGYQPYFLNDTKSVETKYVFTEHESQGGTGAFGGNSRSGTNNYEIKGDLITKTWVMKNVPALQEEEFTTTTKNHIAKIEFQLNQIAYPNSIPKDYSNSWELIASELLDHDRFGVQIRKSNAWIDEITQSIVKPGNSIQENTKRVFEYVRDNFTCEQHSGYYASDNLKTIFKNKKGNVADINLLLIAFLKNINVNVHPVILSTRNFGAPHEFYPLMDRYNYVIAQVTFDSMVVYLDATESKLGFGKLPGYCYNGYARVINSQGSPIEFNTDSLLEKNSTMVLISNMENGSISGNIGIKYGEIESFYLRKKLSKTSKDEYLKSLKDDFSESIEIQKIDIDSLNKYDYPIKINIDADFKQFEESEMVYFTPVFTNLFNKNPFTDADRFYPIEMPYVMEKAFTLNMEVPKNYMVEELPKSVRISFNDTDGMFEYLISNSNGYIQLRSKLVFHKSVFSQEDYQNLRDFFDFVVSKLKEKIVFKKVKS